MANSKVKEIDAAEALKLFTKQTISVQTATPVKVRGEDGKERPSFKTKDEPLAAEHVISAKDYGDRVTITTIDGRRHEATRKGKAAEVAA